MPGEPPRELSLDIDVLSLAVNDGAIPDGERLGRLVERRLQELLEEDDRVFDGAKEELDEVRVSTQMGTLASGDAGIAESLALALYRALGRME
jgi:hypothetical protein